MKLYIDADVWLNFWQGEMIGLKPAFYYTTELLEKAVEKKWIIIFSEAVKSEILKKKIALRDLEEKLSELEQEGLLEYAEIEKEDYEKAEQIYRETGLHFPDSLHAALAVKYKAVMVTRTRHFNVVENILEVRKPEDLL